MGLIDQTGLVWFQIPGTTRAKLFLSGWISFLWSQVIQSAAAGVIVLACRVEGGKVDVVRSPAHGAAAGTTALGPGMNLQCREGGREGEKTHALRMNKVTQRSDPGGSLRSCGSEAKAFLNRAGFASPLGSWCFAKHGD